MPPSAYHQKFLERSDEEMERRAKVKAIELRKVLAAVPFTPAHDPIRIAVLGCADRRHVTAHRQAFEGVLGKPVEVTTFDIDAEHLTGELGVVRHDVTTSLPDGPYDVAFSHVLLKFIETEKQWDVLQKSYDALRAPGLAIHIFDTEDVETTARKQTDGYWSVPLERWKTKLAEKGIAYHALKWDVTPREMPIPIRGVRGGALVLVKKS